MTAIDTAPTAAPSTSILADRLAVLRDLREAQAAISARLKLVWDAVQEQQKAEYDEDRRLEAAIADAESQVKVLALDHYNRTSEKKPAAGVEIKVSELPQYSEAEAFAWAKTTRLALVPEALDRKAFEKIARATELPFVSTITVPKVFIASDLTKVVL